MNEKDSMVFALGIDPGPARPASLAACAALGLDIDSGVVRVRHQAVHLSKEALEPFLQQETILSDRRLGLVAIAAPMTPSFIGKKPWKARAIEIRLSRGAFSGGARGPAMPWISNERTTWPRYVRTARLQAVLQSSLLFPLLTMPNEDSAIELPHRSLAEVYPKATLALLTTKARLPDRPYTHQLMGQLDDWLFPKLFTTSTSDAPPIVRTLASLGLQLAPEVLREAERITLLRRPFPRREPMRAFLAAFQGLLALRGSACLAGAAGDHEGAVLLPAEWHPDWETEWQDPRRSVPSVRRISVRPQIRQVGRLDFLVEADVTQDTPAAALSSGISIL